MDWKESAIDKMHGFLLHKLNENNEKYNKQENERDGCSLLQSAPPSPSGQRQMLQLFGSGYPPARQFKWFLP